MTYLAWGLVIFLTALVTMLVTAVLTSRPERIPLARLADPAPLPGELPRAGRLPFVFAQDPADEMDMEPSELTRHEWDPDYGPFPVDTGPLLILSDKMAANVALEREIRQRCAEAEAKIPPRWR